MPLPDVAAPPAPRFPEDWPKLGLGCAPLGDLFDPIPEADAFALLNAAWAAGVRFYDTAPWYGHGISEHRLGALLRQHDRADALLSTKVGRVYTPAPRGEDVRITWKGGLNFARHFDYTAEGFAASIAQSQLRLGTPVIDMLVIHDLDGPHHGDAMEGHVADLMRSGFPYLQELKAAGVISAIGMGVNRTVEFERFSDEIPVDYFIVAMPYTLLDQESLHGPMARCVERGIKVVIGAPLASGILSNPSAPGVRYAYEPAPETIVKKALAIEAVCARYDVPLTAAALQFPLLHPAVVSVIPGANVAAHIEANVRNVSMPIPPELWADLKRGGLIAEDAPVG